MTGEPHAREYDHRPQHHHHPRERAGIVAQVGFGAARQRHLGGHLLEQPPHPRPLARRQPRRVDPVHHVARGVQEGFVLVSAMHITASVFVNDHESGLWADILKWLDETIAPWEPGRYRHNETGEDNAAAHLRSLTIGHEVIVPITAGKLDLGPWQRVFYGEWDGQRKKRVIIKVLGE